MEKRLPQHTILVVDDQPINVDVLHDILRDDYRVKVALNGEQALNLARSEEPPDLVLLDIMMPTIDGFEVCHRLKSNPFTRSIPVIFVTAMTDAIDESRGFELGAVDYITKPVSPPLVQARVRTHLALYDQSRSLEEMVRKRTGELQAANQQLAQERARFEWVVHTAEDGYLILDSQDHILFANARARLYLGLPPDDSYITESFIDLARQMYKLETRDAWEKPLAQLEFQSRYLIRPETPTSQSFWLSVDIMEMSEDEQEKHWVVRLRDVTEQIRDWTNWGTFTEMVNHKLRTPLTVIMSSIQLLYKHGGELSQDEVIETASLADRGVKRLHATIENVLAYTDLQQLAKPDEGFELSKLQDVATEIAANLGIEHIGVACGGILIKSRLGLSRRVLELILWELLENAHKFHPKQAPSVELLVIPAPNGMAELLVRDNGLTLSPAQLQKLWTPYYQAEKFFSGETPGMGLGLARVASLVWSVGGKCSAYNRDDGPGLVIDLHIPLVNETIDK
ncbi:MAG: response regulator [Chloroflexota bacterium]